MAENKHARAKGEPVYDIDEKGKITGRTKGAGGAYVGGYDPEQKSLTQILRDTDKALGRKDTLPLRPGQDRYPPDRVEDVPGYRRRNSEKVFSEDEDMNEDRYAKGGPVRNATKVKNKGYRPF